jgi:hypothetical protein
MDYLTTSASALAALPSILPWALLLDGRRRSAAAAFLACLAWTAWLATLCIDSPTPVLGGLTLVGGANFMGLIVFWPARCART